jgi:hypothetical protein
MNFIAISATSFPAGAWPAIDVKVELTADHSQTTDICSIGDRRPCRPVHQGCTARLSSESILIRALRCLFGNGDFRQHWWWHATGNRRVSHAKAHSELANDGAGKFELVSSRFLVTIHPGI